MKVSALVVFLVVFLGCVTMPPKPDVFSGITADCGGEEVAAQMTEAWPGVRKCLGKAEPRPCLAELTPAHSLDAVACSVRDQGAMASSSVAAGKDVEANTVIAKAAKDWITTERIGYRQ